MVQEFSENSINGKVYLFSTIHSLSCKLISFYHVFLSGEGRFWDTGKKPAEAKETVS